jgi:Cu/Zn superoxide dismutase
MKRLLASALLVGASFAVTGVAGATAMEANLKLAPLNNSGETATAKLVQQPDGSLTVTVLTKNGGTDAQPVHIHEGGCTDGGNVTYKLTNVIDGKSETTLKDVKLSDLTAKPHVVNIHKSMKEMGTYVACALIQS